MNIIEIAGHLGSDPEVRFTANNLKVTSFRVATNSRRKDQEETIWWRVTIFGDRFDKMLTYLKKGSAIIVVGELNKPEIYTDKNGNPQVSLDIIAEFIRFSPFGKPDSSRQEQQNNGYEQKQPHQSPYNNEQRPPQQQLSAQYNPFNSLEQESRNPYAVGNQIMSGQSYTSQDPEEEKIPF